MTLVRLSVLGLVLLLSCCSDDASGANGGDTGNTDDTGGDDTGGDDTGGQDTGGADLVEEVADLGPRTNTCVGPGAAAVDNASVPEGYCAWTFADNLGQPRGIALAANGDLLVVERSRAQITALWDANGDGVSDSDERTTLVGQNGLNHGIVPHGGFLYASSDDTVYRWPYDGSTRAFLGDAQTVVIGIPGGGHSTRTLAIDDQDRLYVTIGSGGNIDGNSDRARLLRFQLPEDLQSALQWSSGEVFADGMRNIVGLGWDAQDRLWGVENGLDNLNRGDLGGDIHNDNPAEEVNLFATTGGFYGYPQCWSEFSLPAGVGEGPGTQWVTPGFEDTYSDAWCRDTDNVVPPMFAMQAHSAPLDITFYDGGSFPAEVVGDALISFHGSWNRNTPTGYKVMRLNFVGGQPQGLTPLFEYGGNGDIAGDWPHRPVGIVVGSDGQVYVSSDASGVIIAIGHEGS